MAGGDVVESGLEFTLVAIAGASVWNLGAGKVGQQDDRDRLNETLKYHCLLNKTIAVKHKLEVK